jgi:hypothetical protein
MYFASNLAADQAADLYLTSEQECRNADRIIGEGMSVGATELP